MLQFTAIALLLAGFSLQGTNAAENSLFYSNLKGVIKLGNLSISFGPNIKNKYIREDVLAAKLEEKNPDGSAKRTLELFITNEKKPHVDIYQGSWCFSEIIDGGKPSEDYARTCPNKPVGGKSEEAVISKLLGELFHDVLKFINKETIIPPIKWEKGEYEALKEAWKKGEITGKPPAWHYPGI